MQHTKMFAVVLINPKYLDLEFFGFLSLNVLTKFGSNHSFFILTFQGLLIIQYIDLKEEKGSTFWIKVTDLSISIS